MRRLYKEVSVVKAEDGFGLALDGKPIITPGKNPFVVTQESLAALVAQEWQAQGETVKPQTMILTRFVNTALDKVQPRYDEVVAEVAAFGGSDLVCYRASEPADLVQHQQETWDPYIAWAHNHYGVSLKTTCGIMPIQQSDTTLKTFVDVVAKHDPFELTALHSFTSGFGSLVLALAFMERHKSLEEVWSASQLDEAYQIAQWGEDAEEAELRANLHQELQQAAQYLNCLRGET